MHKEILSKEQADLLPLVKTFSKNFGLVGGIKDHFSINEIAKKANAIFGQEFNEKIFRTQLAYFDDINYSEEIVFKKGFEIDDKVIKNSLIEFSLN